MEEKRQQMVYDLKTKYGFGSPEILSIMLQIPRHEFVSKKYKEIAYADNPVPLGYGVTMSQPYTVAYMTSLLDLTKNDKVLEIGTGSGYQAAILSKIAKEVYSVEIIPALGSKAEKTLKRLGINNVHVKLGTGEQGWRKQAPFDAIVITAGISGKVPKELFRQLKSGSVLVAPVGDNDDKKMIRYTKKDDNNIYEEELGVFKFVPFVRAK